jgi:hypothetical protein
MKNKGLLLLMFSLLAVVFFSCNPSGDLPEEEEESKIENTVPYGVGMNEKVIQDSRGRYVRYYNYLFKVKGYVKEKGLPRQQLSEVFLKRDKSALISVPKQKKWLLDEYSQKWLDNSYIDHEVYQIGHVWVYEEVKKEKEEEVK